MSPLLASPEPLYSTLAAEPDLAELVQLFVDELPHRLQAIAHLVEREDYPAVARAVHQLKGAGGSYGFPAITAVAMHLEYAAKSEAAHVQISELWHELREVCGRCRAGTPGSL